MSPIYHRSHQEVIAQSCISTHSGIMQHDSRARYTGINILPFGTTPSFLVREGEGWHLYLVADNSSLLTLSGDLPEELAVSKATDYVRSFEGQKRYNLAINGIRPYLQRRKNTIQTKNTE